jgi:predicted HTH domain antitoxin
MTKLDEKLIDNKTGSEIAADIMEVFFDDPEFRFIVAGKLYDSGKLTQGEAAQLAQMSRIEFLGKLGQYGFHAINLRGSEVDQEIKAVREMTEELKRHRNNHQSQENTDDKIRTN